MPPERNRWLHKIWKETPGKKEKEMIHADIIESLKKIRIYTYQKEAIVGINRLIKKIEDDL